MTEDGRPQAGGYLFTGKLGSLGYAYGEYSTR